MPATNPKPPFTNGIATKAELAALERRVAAAEASIRVLLEQANLPPGQVARHRPASREED